MMFPNPHDVHTAMRMLPGGGYEDATRAPRQLVREPSRRGTELLLLVIAAAMIAGALSPLLMSGQGG